MYLAAICSEIMQTDQQQQQVKHILKILSNETLKQNINNFKGIVENVT